MYILNRWVTIAVVTAGVAAATTVPMAAGVFIAEREALAREQRAVQTFADATIKHMNFVTEEARNAINAMASYEGSRCSKSHLAELRAVASTYRYIHDAGIYGERGYLCSALVGSVANTPIEMPRPDLVAADGTAVWFNAPNPAGGRERLLIGRASFFVSIDQGTFVDAINASTYTVTAFDATNRQVFATAAPLDSNELTAARRGSRAAAATVAVRHAKHLPISVVVEDVKHPAVWNWPALLAAWGLCGGIVGLICGALVLRSLAHSVSLEADLSRAIRRRNIEVQYQPIVRLLDGTCVGAEALVRWRRDGALIPPDIFIPIAESSPLIEALTDAVLRTVMTELNDTFVRRRDFYVTINLSARDLSTPRFLTVLKTALSRSPINSDQIRLEATERKLVEREACLEVVTAFRSAGHPVYIDDFGTGYSNLAFLQDFPIDALKIDKSFIHNIDQRAPTSDVTPHIVAMAAALGLKVIAEGVETHEQERYLREIGVDFVQGWLYSKSLPANEFVEHFLG